MQNPDLEHAKKKKKTASRNCVLVVPNELHAVNIVIVIKQSAIIRGGY